MMIGAQVMQGDEANAAGALGVLPRQVAGGAAPPRQTRRQFPIPGPWRDRAGRFSALKAAVFLAVLMPGAVEIAWWIGGDLGARPLKAVLLAAGLWTVRLLLITLAITPLRFLGQWSRVMQLRRMLGVATMAYALAHFSLYIADENFRLVTVALEIVRHIYLTIGFVALLGLVTLGVTSTDGWVRRLGRRWKTLHRLVYGIAVLGLLHFFMQAKLNVSPAVLMAGCFVWLMLWRVLPDRIRVRGWAVLALAPVAAAITAGLEYAWYGIATRIDPMRVLDANFSLAHGPRPAVWIGIAGLAIAVAVLLRRLEVMLQDRRRAA